MKSNYNALLSAMVAKGISEDVADSILASQDIVPPAVSYAALVKGATNETALRWFKAYLVEACKPENDAKLGYYLSKLNRHFSPETKGKKYGKNDFAQDVIDGLDVNECLPKIGTWTKLPTPTDAELLLAWEYAKASGNALLIERVARKASVFAPVDTEKPIALDGIETPIVL